MASASPPTPERAGPAGPLSGVRVLDLSAYIAGPYGCTMLADQGAEVIKVESPDGDNLRNYPSTLQAESRAFIGVNRSKRGLVLDLKQPEGLRDRISRARERLVEQLGARPGDEEFAAHERVADHGRVWAKTLP